MRYLKPIKFNLTVLVLTCLLLVGCDTTVMEPIQQGGFTIAFNLYEDAIVTLTIENSYNTVVKVLADHEPFFSGFNEVDWDCRDKDGKVVIEGIYFYRLIVENSKGKSESIIKIILINP